MCTFHSIVCPARLDKMVEACILHGNFYDYFGDGAQVLSVEFRFMKDRGHVNNKYLNLVLRYQQFFFLSTCTCGGVKHI